MNADLIDIFNSVRDIPYRISLVCGQDANCCVDKTLKLSSLLRENGMQTKLVHCDFFWSHQFFLPNELRRIPHSDSSSHVYLEFLSGDKWIALDPTWDKGLASVLPVTVWDGKSNTQIAIRPSTIYSPQDHIDFIYSQEDLETNGEFYRAFNNWLESIRSSK